MLEMLEFLRQHPAIAKQYENFLNERKNEVASLNLVTQAEGRSHRAGEPAPTVVTISAPADVDREIARIIDNKTPSPPAKGKKLAVNDAFKFLLANPLAMNTVYQEFFSQVLKDPNPEGCWDLKGHINVYRNSKGALKKNAQIHFFAKPFASAQLAYFLVLKEIPEKNLYNNCGNDRCVNPDHHNLGRKGKLKRHVVNRDLVQARTREHMDAIVEYLEIDPERGATGLELQTRFIAKKEMTLEEYADALKLGQVETKFHFRTSVGRIYLNGYPSMNNVEAASKALGRAGFPSKF